MKPLITLGRPVFVTLRLSNSLALISMVATRLPKALFRVRWVSASCLLGWVSIGLVGCQTLANPKAVSNAPTIDISTAHGLMQQTMLHRFDKSYDYQKTTHYQVASLYPVDDVEARDNSLFFTILQVFTGNNQYPKTRTITSQQLDCEDNYSRRYQAIIDQTQAQNPGAAANTATGTTQTITREQANTQIADEYAAYERCLTQTPQAKAKTSTESETKPDNLGNPKISDTEITPANEYTTIDSIASQQPKDGSYQTTVKKLITFFNMLDQNMQASANKTDEITPTSLPTQTPNSRAPQKNTDSSSDSLGLPQADATRPHNPENNKPVIIETGDFPTSPTSEGVGSNSSAIVEVLRNLRITPEQIEVLNDAYLNPKTIRHQGSYNRDTGQFSSVLEESSDSPYAQSYKRIPMLIDFNKMSVTFEPDAILPFAGLFFEKELPATLAGKSIKFVLPDNLRQNIPLPILRDTLINAIGQAYGDIDAEKFNELKPASDEYARRINASRVIKVNLTPKELGFVAGRTLKHWSQSLETVREQHPEYIKNDTNFAATLDLMAAANRLYRAEDLAKITQLIEAVLPVSYNSYNYYYFDRHNQLIGYRKIRDYQSGLLKARGKSTTISQIDYQTTSEQHRYYQPKPETIVDGNALLKKLTNEQRLRSEAEDARFGYQNLESLENLDLDSADISGISDTTLEESGKIQMVEE